MLNQFIELVDKYGIRAECSVDIACGKLTILGKEFNIDPPKGQRLLSMSSVDGCVTDTSILGWPMQECIQKCLEKDWRVINAGNGEIHVYNILGEYIGPIRDAVILIKLGVSVPRAATAFLETSEYTAHKFCTVGYSDVIGKHICWQSGELYTANSMEEAAKYSCLNSLMSFKDTLDLREKLINFLNPEVISSYFKEYRPTKESTTETSGVVKETGAGVRDIYSEFMNDIADTLKRRTVPVPVEGDKVEPGNVKSEEPVEAEATYGDNSGAGMGSVRLVWGKRSGEHRQHRTVSPSRIDRSVMPQSGDHKQHNIPKINPNPGYRMPMVEMGSESASKNNPMSYSWMKYSPASGRAKNFPNAHRSYELRLESGDVFGYREGRKGIVYLVDKEDLSIEFKITDKDLQGILKSSKPFKGKIAGKSVVVVQKAVDKVSTDTPSNKARASYTDLKEIYVGLFQSSIHVDEYDLVFDVSRKNLVADLEERASTIKQSVPRALVIKLPTHHPIVKSNISIKRPRMLKKMADHLLGSAESKPQVINFSKRLQQYSMKPKAPKIGGIQPKEPVYTGNENAVLLEIRNAILHGHYSAEFKPASISKGSIKFLDSSNTSEVKSFGVLKNPDRLVLAVNNVSPLFRAEAESVVSRIQRDYPKVFVKRGGKAVEDSVIRYTLKSMPFGGEDYLVLIIALRLPKRGESDVVRSKKLHDLTKNMDRVGSMTALLKSIEEGQQKINVLSKQMETDSNGELRKQLAVLMAAQEDRAKAANEISKSTLVMNAPIYSVKKSNSWLTVEVVDYNIYKGTVTVRQVRGGNRNKEEVTSLYTFAGNKQII